MRRLVKGGRRLKVGLGKVNEKATEVDTPVQMYAFILFVQGRIQGIEG